MVSGKTLAIAGAFFVSWVAVTAINPVVGAFLGVILGVILIFLMPDGIQEEKRRPQLRQQQPEPSAPTRTIPSVVKRHVWRRDGGRCVECGSKENLEYDYTLPVANGGNSSERNVQLLCAKCSRKRNFKLM